MYLNMKKSLLIRTTDVFSNCHLKPTMIYCLITLRCKTIDNQNKAFACSCGCLKGELQVTSCGYIGVASYELFLLESQVARVKL